jgi:hypothetical protein
LTTDNEEIPAQLLQACTLQLATGLLREFGERVSPEKSKNYPIDAKP